MLLDMLYSPATWIFLFVIYLAIMFLIQLFFSLRWSFWPGLLMPLLFLLIWLNFALDLNLLPLDKFISVTEPVKQVWATIGQVGFLLSLLFYILVRMTKRMKRRAVSERKEQIMAEKQRLMAEREGHRQPNSANPAPAAGMQQHSAANPVPAAQAQPAQAPAAQRAQQQSAAQAQPAQAPAPAAAEAAWPGEDSQVTRQYSRKKDAKPEDEYTQVFKIDRQAVYAAAQADPAAGEAPAPESMVRPVPREWNGQNPKKDPNS
ncbi:MAG: hypothetical protein K6B40_02960 [Firmicutes bacterium]|nr:hypothetical protein [Bacillota bacterium]